MPCAAPLPVHDWVARARARPAGHTSACFNLSVYASAYLIWVWHWRHPLPARRLSFREDFAADLLNVLAKTWMLVGGRGRVQAAVDG